MTIGNFSEVVGSVGADNLVGADLEILYGLEGNDSLTAVTSSTPGVVTNTIVVGSSGDDTYQVANNSILVVLENGNSDNDFGQATGIGLMKDTSFSLEIDNGRHLFVGDTESNQYVLLIDWQVPENRIESFETADGIFSYEQIVNGFRNLPGYLGSVTWEEAIAQQGFNLERLGLSPEIIDEALAQVIARSTELESAVAIAETTASSPILEANDMLLDNSMEVDPLSNSAFETDTDLLVGEGASNLILAKSHLNQTFSLDGSQTYLLASRDEYNGLETSSIPLDAEEIDLSEFALYGAGSDREIINRPFPNTQNNSVFYANFAETVAIGNDGDLSDTFLGQEDVF